MERHLHLDSDTTEKIIKKTKQTSAILKQKLSGYTNAITSSAFFKDKCKAVFESVDMDKSGTVDVKELYAAILLVYLQLAKIVSGLTPPTQADMKVLIKKIDLDGEEGLNLEEFTILTTILMQNIAGRIITQLILSLCLIPITASIVLTILAWLSPPHKIWSYLIPKGIPTTILATAISMVALPYLLDQVDDYYAKMASYKVDEKKST